MNKLLSLFHRRKSEQELDDEFKFHLQQQSEEYLAKGMTPEEARYAAMRARQLPFHNADRLVWIWGTRTDRDKAFFSIT